MKKGQKFLMSTKLTPITKREARKLFDAGIDISIGGHDVTGEGATWMVSQFVKKPKLTTFNEICDYFERYYCRGVGRFLRTEFYKHEVAGREE